MGPLPFFISFFLLSVMDFNTAMAKAICRGARWGQISFRWKVSHHHVHLCPNPLMLHWFLELCVCVFVVVPVMRKIQAVTQWGQRYDGLDLLGQMRTSWDLFFFCLLECYMSSSSLVNIYHCLLPSPLFPVSKEATQI